MLEATMRFLENACFIAADWHWTGYLTCYDLPLLRSFGISILVAGLGAFVLLGMTWRDRERLFGTAHLPRRV
jgi:hypothetical protein